jgi:hypothetical protein
MLSNNLREDLEKIILGELFGKIKQAMIKHSDKQTKKDLEITAKQRQGLYDPKPKPAIRKV